MSHVRTYLGITVPIISAYIVVFLGGEFFSDWLDTDVNPWLGGHL